MPYTHDFGRTPWTATWSWNTGAPAARVRLQTKASCDAVSDEAFTADVEFNAVEPSEAGLPEYELVGDALTGGAA